MHRRDDPLWHLLDGSGTRRTTGAARSGGAETDAGQGGAARRKGGRACCRRATERGEARRWDGQARCIDSEGIVEADEATNPRRARRRHANRRFRDSHHPAAPTETEPPSPELAATRRLCVAERVGRMVRVTLRMGDAHSLRYE